MRRFFLVSPLLLLIACGVKEIKKEGIDYLGQTPPDSVAKLFAPGIVSTDSFEHSAPVFSPDGRVVLWNVVSRLEPDYLLESTYEDGKWSAPHKPSFSDTTADDYYPGFSPDGRTLYFASRRSVPAGYHGNNMRLWQVDRTDDGWARPVPFDTSVSKGTEYAHSITRDGKLYFSSSQDWNIHESTFDNGKYSGSASMPFGINSAGYEDGAFIAPDESFLIFESHRAEGVNGSIDLYISYRLDDNTWSFPINMGPTINTAKTERLAKLSPDGKYLFFGSDRNVIPPAWGFDLYWISASVIDKLRSNPLANIPIERPLGDELINALASNLTDEAALLLREWLSKYPDDIEATRVYIHTLRMQRNYKAAEDLIASAPDDWMNSVMYKMEVALIKFGLSKDKEAAAILETLLGPSDALQPTYWQIIRGLQEMRLYDLTDHYFDELASTGISPVHTYNQACFYAKEGEKDRAFSYLNRAADNGYNETSQYENDTDLVSLKSDSRWNLLRKKLK